MKGMSCIPLNQLNAFILLGLITQLLLVYGGGLSTTDVELVVSNTQHHDLLIRPKVRCKEDKLLEQWKNQSSITVSVYI